MRLLRPLLTLTMMFGIARAADAIPAPATIPDPAALAVVYIPDLAQALDHLEAFLQAVNPLTPKGMMKMRLGMMLSDPQLANLGKGPTVIIVSPGMPMPEVVMVMPAVNPELYADALSKNKFLTKVVGSNVVMAKLPSGLETGERLIAQLPALSANQVQGELRAMIALDRVMTTYGPFLTGMVGMMAMQGGKQPGMEFIPVYIAGLQLVSADIEVLQLDLSFGVEALGFTSTLAAKPGSELAKALIAPKVTAKAPAKLGDAKGLAVMTGRVNQPAQLGYVLHLLRALQARPDTKKLVTDDLLDLVKLQAESSTGDIAARYLSSEQSFSAQIVTGITNPVKAEAAAVAGFDLMKPGSTMGTMYQNMGMTMTVTKNVRKIGAVSIHRAAWSLDASKMPPDQADQMKRFMMDSEFAYAGGFSFTSAGAPIDGLLTGGGKAPILTAAKTFGTDRHMYADADINGFAAMIASVIPNSAELATTLKKLPPLPPITAAGTIAGGRARGELNIPVKALAEITKVMNAEKPQRPGKKPGQNQPPKEADPTF